MADMTMKAFLEYHLAFVREHLVHAANTTPQDFYDGGQDWEALDLHDVVVVESLAHSWGCIEGAAAMADLTIVELLERFGLQLNTPKPKRTRPRCPKCGGKTHRCKTGQCRHCDSCDHAWIPEEAHRG